MIVFITAQDAPTQDNLQVAGHLAAEAATALCGPQAVRDNIMAALDAAPADPFIAFSHGHPAFLQGHDDRPAVTITDTEFLGGRESFALACHTASELGPGVAAQGGTWFGFAGPVNCLPADEDSVGYFIAIVDFVAERFPGCDTLESADAFIAGLAQLADQAHNAIEATDTYTFEILHALRDITRRLRIWLPYAIEPVKHREAFGEPIL